MSVEAAQTSLFSRQPRSVLDWLTVNHLKRGALLYWATLFTVSAAAIHFIGVLAQPPQSGFLAALLLGSALAQVAIALSVIAVPARRLLIIAAVIEGVAMLFWIFARTAGLPIGLPGSVTVWQPETLGSPDFYLPVMEGISAYFFLCLSGRTWIGLPRAWRIILALLPSLLLVSLLLWSVVSALVNTYAFEAVVANFIFIAEVPTSLRALFLPTAGLLALFLLLRFVFPRLRAMTKGAGRNALVLLPALLLVSLLTWAGSSTAAVRAWLPMSSTVSAPAGQTTTLAYCRPGGSPLAMDLSEPSARAPRPVPVVFYVHGGAGFLNSRNLQTDPDGVYFMQLRNELLNRGFAVGSIDYPFIPLYSGQDMVKDAKCAVRFLRAHASELGIDLQRIGVYGDSEGGYISAMLGTAGPQAGFDVGQYLNQSSRVQAVVDLWGFTDLTNFSGSPSWVLPLGDNRSISYLRANSPVTYVAPGKPPFLIIHGTDDPLIAPHHSQDLARRLHAVGVPVTLISVQHGNHGLDAPTPGKTQQPGADTLVHMISDFFVRTLAA